MSKPLPKLMANEDLRLRLLQLAREERLHPCLLFEGPSGVGKALSARWLAMTVNCEQQGSEPCEQCWSCRQIAKGQHPDVIEIGYDPERTAQVISVRQTRELISALILRPFQAKRRFVIIDPVDAMGNEAANSLLKTFEEPPQQTGFILVTHVASRLLPTVRSRSQRIRFSPVPRPELLAWLEERGVERAEQVADSAQGCPGRALRLADGEVERWIEATDMLVAALAGPVGERLAFSEKLTKGNRGVWVPKVERTLDVLATLLRDVQAHRSGRPLLHRDHPDLVARWSEGLGHSGSSRLLASLDQARQDLELYVNARLVLDALFAQVHVELGAHG